MANYGKTYHGLTKPEWAERLNVKTVTFYKLCKIHGFEKAVELRGINPVGRGQGSKPKSRDKTLTEFCCKPGHHVLHDGKEIEVAEVMENGSDEKKRNAYITGYRVVDGFTLKRTIIHAGYDWSRI